MAMLMTLRRMGRGDLTTHGFRARSRLDFRSTALPHEVMEVALAHTIGGKVEAAYRRGDLLESGGRPWKLGRAFCDSPATTSNVVALR